MTQALAANPPRQRVTDVVARFDAGSIAPCKAGSLVAAHFATPRGEVIITMRERDWVAGARAERDHHGNRFRTLAEIDARDQPRTVPLPERITSYAPRLAPSVLAACEAVEAKCAGAPRGAATFLCRAAGLRYQTFMYWRHRERILARREERRRAPVPKPGGQIL